MSNRQYKSQASSSRAALGGGGFGGFGSASSSRGSVLSYLTPPPDLKAVSDPNIVVAFKGLSKKDATTKSKALEDLRALVQSPPESPQEIDGAILDTWVQFYPKLAIDNSRRVRELAHQVQQHMTTADKKRMQKLMPDIVATWLAGMSDRDRAVSKAARDGLAAFLNTDDKILICWKVFQPQILDYARCALDETPQSLCDDRSMSPDEMQETYLRVIGSSVSLVESLLTQMNKSDLLKHLEKYELYFNNSPAKLWGLVSCEDAFVRRLAARLLDICLRKQCGFVEANLELISKAFIAEALSSSQTSSAFQLIQALEPLTKAYPEVWTSSYRTKKSAFSKLQKFIAKGSQGGPAAYWQSLQSLLARLPSGVLPTDINALLDFLSAIRDGINSREEPRGNAELAWTSYFHIADHLAKDLPDETLQGKLFQQSVFPIFEHYMHPSAESSKWSLGQNRPALANAFVICASTRDATLRTSLSHEFERLAGDFIIRLRTSLPMQSKDYETSQTSIVAEGHRWFSFVNEVFTFVPEIETSKILEQNSSKIISASFAAITIRNGKAYSAAAVVDTAMRLTPRLFRNTENMDSLMIFFERDFNGLLDSPSMEYLVSMLHNVVHFAEQQSEFAKFWQSAIRNVLLLPEDEEERKIRTITAFIASYDVSDIAALNDELQAFLHSIFVKALHGDQQAWPVFETAVTFHTIASAQESLLVALILSGLDIINVYVEFALNALELLAKKHKDVLQDHNTRISLLTKLLALSEVKDNTTVSSKAIALRTFVEPYAEDLEKIGIVRNRVVELVHNELETASPQSLLISTLLKEAKDALALGQTPEVVASFFPDPLHWGDALAPFLRKHPSLELGVLRPFGGAVFLVRDHNCTHPSNIPRDTMGYSMALRMALYATRLLCLRDVPQIVPKEQEVHYLYFLALTYELVNDQIDLREENMLFASNLDPDSMDEIREMLRSILSIFSLRVCRAPSWQEDAPKLPHYDTSQPARDLISRLIEVSGSPEPQGYYAGKALSRFLGILWARQDYAGGDNWLQQLGIMNSTTQNIFGASAILIGLGHNLRNQNVVHILCNNLVSDIATSSPHDEKTFSKLVLLNSCLMVYEDEIEIPVVAQIRLISVVKQILSWSEILTTTHIELASEVCRALHRLLPAIKDVYGSYWQNALELVAAIWSSDRTDKLSGNKLPAIGMSLKLVSILQDLEDANDDLTDALAFTNKIISRGLVDLLKLQRSTNNLPLQFVDELLLRKVSKINTATISDVSELFPLLASDFRLVQSAAFGILQKVVVDAQQQVSLDAALDGIDATLSEELLSLLLDAPTIDQYDDANLELFPIAVRGYLLSWHLVFDSFSSASSRVRSNYSALIEDGNYIEPFLNFMFDVLGHSAASALKLEKKGLDDAMIRKYDMSAAMNLESSERDMHWLLVNLYYLGLKYIPGTVKKWWLTCKDRQTSIAVEAWTEKYFSNLVVQDLLDDVIQWSDTQETGSEDEKTLSIRVSKNSREVFAGYEIDEMETSIVIRLPSTYPLKIAAVESVNRVGIPEAKWQNFLRYTQGAIQFTNGSVIDGLETFRKNVAISLKGHEECAICYSIVSSPGRKLPDKECPTCHHKFHNECLYQWFKQGHSNRCPLCRNAFPYGAKLANRPR